MQREVDALYHYLNSGFGISYTPAMFAGLGELYVADTRFTKNIDKYGEGFSGFLKKATRIYADSISEI